MPNLTRRQLFRSGIAVGAGLSLTACRGGGRDIPDGAARVVEHAMGSAEVSPRPQQVITLDDTFTSAVLALGTQLAGYTTSRANSTQLPDYLGPDASHGSDATWVGTLSDPNVERIASVRPDLILSAKVRHERLFEQLSEIAPTVFSHTTGASWKENLRLTGRALGKAQRAEEVIERYQRRARTVGDNIRSAVGHNPTISIVRFAGEPTVRLYTPRSFPGTVCGDAGLTRPEGQPSGNGIAVNLSQERIRELDAEHIFISAYPDKAGDAVRARSDFQSNPLWQRLRGQQHEVNDVTWMTAVGPHGAHVILDDLAGTFGVDPAR